MTQILNPYWFPAFPAVIWCVFLPPNTLKSCSVNSRERVERAWTITGNYARHVRFALISLSRTSRLHVLQTAFLIHVAKGAVWDRIFSSTLTCHSAKSQPTSSKRPRLGGCQRGFLITQAAFLRRFSTILMKRCSNSNAPPSPTREARARLQIPRADKRYQASQGILKAKMKPSEEEMLCCAIRNNMYSLAHDMGRRYAKQLDWTWTGWAGSASVDHLCRASTVLSDTDTQGT